MGSSSGSSSAAASGGGSGSSGGAGTAQGLASLLESSWKLYASRAQYEASKDWRKQQYTLTARSVYTDLREGYRALQQREMEEIAGAYYSIDTISRQSMLATSAALAQTAGSGVAGNAATAVIDRIRRAQLENTNIVEMNTRFLMRQRERQGLQLQAQAYQQLIAAMGAPIQKPDYLGQSIKIATDAFGVIAGMG